MNKLIYLPIKLFKMIKKIAYFILVITLFSSCLSYNYTHRTGEIPYPANLGIKNSFVVDVDIDLNKKVTASSQNHADKQDALDEAYYNCITQNDIDIVIHPIYKLTKIKFPIFTFLNKYRYEIHGYSGYYKNPTTKTEWENTKEVIAAAHELTMENAKLEKTKVQMRGEDEVFSVRGKNLNTLSKIDPSARESKSSYMIETVEGCCGENKNNVVVNGNSSGNGFGNVHLLHTTDNHSSLVDEYNKLITNCRDCGNDYKPDQVIDETTREKKKRNSIKKGFLGKLFKRVNDVGKVAILGTD